MALLASELQRVRYELGYNNLAVGAEPYVSYVAMFDKVVQVYLSAGAITSSATPVVASGVAAPFALTLTSPTGFTSGDIVIVDVDDRQEIVTSQALVGSTLTVLLIKPHSGTYPVTVEGGEGIVRENLNRIRETKAKMAQSFGSGSLKQVDEVQFYDTRGKSQFGVLGSQLMFWRDELAGCLGLPNAWRERQGGSLSTVGY